MVQLQNPYAGAAQYATAQRYAAQRAGMAIGRPIERGIAGAYADWQREDERATRESQFKRSLNQRDKEWATGFNATEDDRAWRRERMSDRDRATDEFRDAQQKTDAERYADESARWDRKEKRLGENADMRTLMKMRGQDLVEGRGRDNIELQRDRSRSEEDWRREQRDYRKGRDFIKDSRYYVGLAADAVKEKKSDTYRRRDYRDKGTRAQLAADREKTEGLRKFLERGQNRADVIRSNIRREREVSDDEREFLENYRKVEEALDSIEMSGAGPRPNLFGRNLGPTYDHADDRQGDPFAGSGY